MKTDVKIPIRLFLSNESGYYLDISTYKEVLDERVGQVCVFPVCAVVLLVSYVLCFPPMCCCVVDIFWFVFSLHELLCVLWFVFVLYGLLCYKLVLY